MPVSGQDQGTEQRQAHSSPAQPEFVLPEGMVLVEKATHDAQGGELRRVRKALSEREAADEEREREDREKTAREAGDFEQLAGIEKEKRGKLEARLRKAELGDALRDDISGRGYSGEKAAALKRLVDPDTVQYDSDGVPLQASLMAAVDRVITSYPSMFEQEKPEAPADHGKPPRQPGPSTPPNAADALPTDFVSQDEYANTPWAVRRTPEFQERVKHSEHLWPSLVHRSEFQPAND
jgi:hypothetical protein